MISSYFIHAELRNRARAYKAQAQGSQVHLFATLGYVRLRGGVTIGYVYIVDCTVDLERNRSWESVGLDPKVWSLINQGLKT